MSKEAMKLALEGAANYIDALGGDSRKYRQALAEQHEMKNIERHERNVQKFLAEQPAQQEPFGFAVMENPIAPPAQRTWVGLTDEEVHALWMTGEANIAEEHHSVVAYEIEAKLREKNT